MKWGNRTAGGGGINTVRNIYACTKVKWGKEVYQDVEVNTDEEPIVFKVEYPTLSTVQ